MRGYGFLFKITSLSIVLCSTVSLLGMKNNCKTKLTLYKKHQPIGIDHKDYLENCSKAFQEVDLVQMGYDYSVKNELKNTCQIVPITLLTLPSDMQNKIFNLVENKTSMQQVNKDWNENRSIKKDDVFTYVQLSEKELNCILFNAAYHLNYKGVKNILKNSNVLEYAQDNLPFYHVGDKGFAIRQPVVLDLRGILKYIRANASTWNPLLNKYGINYFTNAECKPTNLQMACLAGESNHVQEILAKGNVSEEDIKFLLNIVTDFDRVKCFKVLCNYENIRSSIDISFLERACSEKSKKVLKEMLAIGKNNQSFHLNEVKKYVPDFNDPDAETGSALDTESNPIPGMVKIKIDILQRTFLDAIIAAAEQDPELWDIVTILKDNGAITANAQKSISIKK